MKGYFNHRSSQQAIKAQESRGGAARQQMFIVMARK